MDDVATDAYLNARFAELRAAIARQDDDDIIRVIDHVRDEAGQPTARHVVAELLRAARSRITDPVSAECITMALARYDHEDGSR